MRERLRHPLTKAAVVLLAAYLVFELGIGYLAPLLGIPSAPVPNSVIVQYMLTVLAGVLIWVSDNEARWTEFKRPLRAVLVEPERRTLRTALLIAVPLLVGAAAYASVRPTVSAPPTLRSIHPAPPSSMSFRGKEMVLADLQNPLRADGSTAEDYALGSDIYFTNCVPCHGDALDGNGHYAHAFNPRPIDLTGTLKDLTESYVFWRVAKGGPGLPKEGTPWHSAMPVWEDFLTEEEIWAVVIFMYEQTRQSPRTWEHEGAEGEH